MSIQVTANLDGSYTVSCGGESVVIGATRTYSATAFASRIPETNVGGVCAYVAVHGGDPHDSWVNPGMRPTYLGMDQLIAGDLSDALRTHTIAKDSYLDINTALEPGQTVDVASLVHRVEELGVPASTPAILCLSTRTHTL